MKTVLESFGTLIFLPDIDNLQDLRNAWRHAEITVEGKKTTYFYHDNAAQESEEGPLKT